MEKRTQSAKIVVLGEGRFSIMLLIFNRSESGEDVAHSAVLQEPV